MRGLRIPRKNGKMGVEGSDASDEVGELLKSIIPRFFCTGYGEDEGDTCLNENNSILLIRNFCQNSRRTSCYSTNISI